MAKRVPRVTDPTKPPPGAVFFDVARLHRQEGTSQETGKRYATWKPKRCTGDAGADGRVADRWLVAELSPEAVVRRWGPGRYRIRYYDGNAQLCGAVDWELQLPPGERGEGAPLEGAAPAAAGRESPADRLRGVAGRLDGGGVFELMLLLQESNREAADRAAQQARHDEQARAARDQQFWQQMQAQQQNLLQLLRPGEAAAGGAGVTARELDLLRREQALAVREEVTRLGQQLQTQLAAMVPAEDDDDDDDKPKTPEEAATAAGVNFIEHLGGEVPDLVSKGLGAVRRWLDSQGKPSGPQDVAALLQAVTAAAQQQAQANGAG